MNGSVGDVLPVFYDSGGASRMKPLVVRTDGQTVDPLSKTYSGWIRQLINGSSVPDSTIAGITSNNDQSALWQQWAGRLVTTYRAWDDSNDQEIVAALIPNTDLALRQTLTDADLVNPNYSISAALLPHDPGLPALPYGNLQWKAVENEIPPLEETIGQSMVLFKHGNISVSTNRSLPGVIIVSDYDGIIGDTKTPSYYWVSYEGIPQWVSKYQRQLGDVRDFNSLYASYRTSRQRVLRTLAANLLTLRLSDGQPLGGSVPAVIQTEQSKYLVGLLPDEIAAFNQSRDVSNLVLNRSNLGVINGQPPYTVNSPTVATTAPISLARASDPSLVRLPLEGTTSHPPTRPTGLGATNPPTGLGATNPPTGVPTGTSNTLATAEAGGIKWYWWLLIALAIIVLISIIVYVVIQPSETAPVPVQYRPAAIVLPTSTAQADLHQLPVAPLPPMTVDSGVLISGMPPHDVLPAPPPPISIGGIDLVR